MMYVLPNLPMAEMSGEVERQPGILINGAHVANAIVTVLYGEAVKEPSFTIGVQGRGTLNIPEAEFKQLLGTMATVYREHYAPVAPIAVPCDDAA